MVGSTNPTGLIIFTAILPQFIDRASGNTTLQLLTLGAICVVIAVLSDGLWAIGSGSKRATGSAAPRTVSSGSARRAV